MVSAGKYTTCGIRANGEMVCWGRDSFEEISGLVITPTTLPFGGVGIPYQVTLFAEGGTAPYSYVAESGLLPPGLSLSNDGLLSGVPLRGGDYAFTIRVYDSSSQIQSGRIDYAINIFDVYAVDDEYSLIVGETLVVAAPGVLLNDITEQEGDLMATKISNPENGTIIFRLDGSFNYTPDYGFIGIDSFTYEAMINDITSNLATVTIEVYSNNMYLPFVRR
jgi:hypothetical protein